MENMRSASSEGEEPMSVTQVVSDVLAENTKKNMFLHNVGIQNACSRSSVKNIAAQLEVEKRANCELQSIVNSQREQLYVQMQDADQARIKEQEEMKKKQAEMEEEMKKKQVEMEAKLQKKQDEMEAKLQLVLSQIQPR
jgi:DNA anti-recombination protein RmuC